MPPGREVVVIANAGAGAIVRLSITWAVAGLDAESLTLTVTVNVPETVGVPEMLAPFGLSPPGKPVIVQLYGEAPPLAVTVAE